MVALLFVAPTSKNQFGTAYFKAGNTTTLTFTNSAGSPCSFASLNGHRGEQWSELSLPQPPMLLNRFPIFFRSDWRITISAFYCVL